MDDAENARLAALVEELDRLVPRDNAVVKFEQRGGGPDESRMVGTRNGYLRLGVEVLLGITRPAPDATDAADLHVDIEYLISEKSDIGFGEFTIDEGLLRVEPPRKERFSDRFANLSMQVGCVLAALITAYGFFNGLVSLFTLHLH